MTAKHRLLAAGMLFSSVSALNAWAERNPDSEIRSTTPDFVVGISEKAAADLKAASTNTVASRATATPNATVYGGFELATSATVYILVRGNSLGTLGVTPNYLDAPRLRLYNGQGQDLITDNAGRPGFNGCTDANTAQVPVLNYYQSARGQPAHSRDACVAVTASAGSYTFSVTPSIPGVTTTSTTSSPGSGEILFEVTLGPSGGAPPVDDNRTRTERLVGGTWTFAYTIISNFSDRYTFTSVSPSTASPGDYVATGTGTFGNPVIGTYSSSAAQWAVLDPGTIIDQFYTFTFSDLNHVSGCYYQVTPHGSTNLSRCYSMAGTRSPPKSSAVSDADPLQRQKAAAEASLGEFQDNPEVMNSYRRLREAFERKRSENGLEISMPSPVSKNLQEMPAQHVAGIGARLADDAIQLEPNRVGAKSASARSVASRASATSSATVYGGFELSAPSTVYVLVRGNSLGTLGVTSNFLDAPRLRLFNSAGQDIFFDNVGNAGGNACISTQTIMAPVVNYYRTVRGQAVHDRDACLSATLPSGGYTFTVTPTNTSGSSFNSRPSAGEILFEVTLGP